MICTTQTRSGLIGLSTALIMLIEDDMDHAELIMRTIAEHTIPNKVMHFQDGPSALDYLFHRDPLDDSFLTPRPQLILLDINLPGMNGIDILQTIKASDELRMIPIVMLTTSATEQDIRRAYHNHANSYLVKPIGSEEFKELMDTLCSYWLSSNKVAKIQDVASETGAF